MSFLKPTFLVCIILFSSCDFLSAQTDMSDVHPRKGDILCGTSRPETCPTTDSPVCGYSLKECHSSSSPCSQYQDYPNTCTACSNADMHSYRYGYCSDPGNQGGLMESAFDGDFVSEVSEEDYLHNEENEFLLNEEEVLASSREYCEKGVELSCTIEYDPVCSIKSGCKDDFCRITSTNACTACGSDKADYYIPGECPVVSHII